MASPEEQYLCNALEVTSDGGPRYLRNTPAENVGRLLYESARMGYAMAIKKILKEVADRTDSLFNNSTRTPAHSPDLSMPLQSAALYGRTAVVRVLLEAGADCGKLFQGHSALYAAASNGHAETARLLVEGGAELDATSGEEGRTSLAVAALNGHSGVAQVLLDAGAGVDVRDADDATPLNLAAEIGHADLVRVLLAAGANPNAVKKPMGFTPLLWAAHEGHVEVARLLLKGGAQDRTLAIGGYTPLHLAVLNSNRGLPHGGPPSSASLAHHNQVSGAGPANGIAVNSPHFMGNMVNMVTLLLEDCRSIDAVDSEGRTAIWHAASEGNVEMVALLAGRGADSYRALEVAATGGRMNVVQHLVKLCCTSEGGKHVGALIPLAQKAHAAGQLEVHRFIMTSFKETGSQTFIVKNGALVAEGPLSEERRKAFEAMQAKTRSDKVAALDRHPVDELAPAAAPAAGLRSAPDGEAEAGSEQGKSRGSSKKAQGASQEVFVDPVIAADGFTYERSAIEGWIARKRTSPMTNEPLANTVLIPNHHLRSAVRMLFPAGRGA